ncbi:MAG: peroxiredoxin [Castellaniella sp.]
MSSLHEDQPIPAFTAQGTQGEVSDQDLRGKTTVLFFYPRNNTPGCTTESRDFGERHAEFEAAGCRIIGVSRDTLGSHRRVREKLDLPYPLIADPEEILCNLFGVMKHKTMFGKPVRGIERSTFLIDGEGRLRRQWRKVKVPGHVDEVLQAVRQLS